MPCVDIQIDFHFRQEIECLIETYSYLLEMLANIYINK